MQKLQWFDRKFSFGIPAGMLPFCLDRLEGTILRIENRVKGVSEEMLSHKPDGKWSVKQNIGHLAEVDEVSLKRIDEMINGVPTLSPAVFETKQDYNAQPVAAVIDYFRNIRLKNIARYKALKDEEMVKGSLHPRLKLLLTPVDLAWFDAEHDDHHLVRMSEIIRML